LDRYQREPEYAYNQEADGIPKILHWTDGTRAENDDGTGTKREGVIPKQEKSENNKAKAEAKGSKAKGKGKAPTGKRTFAATAAAAAASSADALSASFGNAIVPSGTRGSGATDGCENPRRNVYDNKIYFGVEPDVFMLVVIAFAFFAGVLVTMLVIKVHGWCCKPKAVTDAWITVSGDRIHIDKECAERLSSSKPVNKKFCKLCTYSGLH
jgi:hypothetical protein